MFKDLKSGSCYYCKRSDKDMGVDRVDNNQGYTEENCVSCCAMCNRMKSDWDVSMFFIKSKMICEKWINSKKLSYHTLFHQESC